MFLSGRSAIVVALVVLLGVVGPARAVCAEGQMAVGTEMLEMFTGPNRSFLEYSGFLMANDCALIAQNGLTEADSQLCRGGYARGASVACDGDNRPVGAVDTLGKSWTCTHTDDISCNEGGTRGMFSVLACCTRNS